MKNILRKIKFFIYTFFNSLKSTEIEVLTSNTDGDNSDNGIHKAVHNERVSHHLLKGEVSQEVVDLRYRDYTVSANAKNLKYTPNGQVVKIKNNANASKFVVKNRDLSLSILDSISFYNSKQFENTHTIKISYNVIPRFKIEKTCTIMKVDINKQQLILHFSKHFNVYNQDKPFVNELKKLSETYLDIKRHEFNEINEINFISFKINGVDDYIKYCFKELVLDQIKESEKEYFLIYKFGLYETENLIDKFYSQEMDEKYKNKEPKKVVYNPFEEEKKFDKCEMCGSDITEEIEEELRSLYTDKNICHMCLYKIMTQNE